MARADTSILQVFGDIVDAFGRLIKIYPDTCEGRRDQAKFKADLAYTNAVNNANRVLKICKKNAQDLASLLLCDTDYNDSITGATAAHDSAYAAADALCAGSSQAFTSASASASRQQLGVQLASISAYPTPPLPSRHFLPPPPTVRLVGAGLAIPIIGEILCYGAVCLGTVAICIANNEPIRCPDWGEFNDDVALWTAYLALLLVCQAALDAAVLKHQLAAAISDPNDEAARFNRDADLNLARAKYEACIIMALDQYLKNGGKPSNERQ
jgi:hypothetical protein